MYMWYVCVLPLHDFVGVEVPLLRELNVLFFSWQCHGIATGPNPLWFWPLPRKTTPFLKLEVALVLQRKLRSKRFLLIWTWPFCIPTEGFSNYFKLLGSKTLLPVLIQLQFPSPLLHSHSPVVLATPCHDSHQPSWPLLFSLLCPAMPLHHQC